MEWKRRFEEVCERLGIRSESRLLLAVSGGLDSMALLRLCCDAGLRITVLHVNFKLRGADSDADQALVETRCRALGVECRSQVLPVDKNTLKDGLQAEARRLRYAWFDEMMAATGADHLLTAHHLDDRLETFFIHLLRGAGVRGLASIPERNGYILRPLLGFSRAELEAYAETTGLQWREDASNASDAYLRNRIRHRLVPELLDLSPDALKAAGRSMDFLTEADEFITRGADDFAKAHLTPMPHGMSRLPISALKHLDQHRTLAKYFFQNLGFGPEDMAAVLDLLDSPSGKMAEGSRLDAWRDRESVVFAPSEPPPQAPVLLTETEGEITEPFPFAWSVGPDGAEQESAEAESAALASGKLTFPLVLRPWAPGDRFVPSGMKGSKKLSDFLTDLKLSVPEKRYVWVLCSGEDICLVVGHRADERYVWKGKGAVLRLQCFPTFG